MFHLHLTLNASMCNYVRSIPYPSSSKTLVQVYWLSLESTYFGFKESLGSFDPLCGDIDFCEASEDTEAAVLCQLSCCCLPEDQQELRKTERTERHGYRETRRNIASHEWLSSGFLVSPLWNWACCPGPRPPPSSCSSTRGVSGELRASPSSSSAPSGQWSCLSQHRTYRIK